MPWSPGVLMAFLIHISEDPGGAQPPPGASVPPAEAGIALNGPGGP